MSGKYVFFDFSTGTYAASHRGKGWGMVNTETGDVDASIYFGLMFYHEDYRLNVSDRVNIFPYSVEDKIILAARDAVRCQ